MKRALQVFFIMLFAYLPFSQLRASLQDPEAAAKERAWQTVQAHVNWARQSTTGARIQAKESARHPDAVQYRFFVIGLPSDAMYLAVSWPIDSAPRQVMKGITIGKEGALTCAGNTPEECSNSDQAKDSPIDFTFYPQKGEPYRLMFISQQNPETKVAIVLVPDPIEGKDKGCGISAVRLTPRFELSYITGVGFPPNSDVVFETQSWDEKHDIPRRTDSDGKVDLIMLPGVAGHDKGTTKIRAVVANSCAPSLQFDWGPVSPAGVGRNLH
jgi:hypothetical protein